MDTGSKKRRRSAGGLYPGLSTRESNTGAMVSCIEYLNIYIYIYIYIYCIQSLYFYWTKALLAYYGSTLFLYFLH